MLIVCTLCARMTFHQLRLGVGEEDGKNYALGECLLCLNKVIVVCSCDTPMQIRQVLRGKIYTGTTYCPACDRLDEMACQPTQETTCESTSVDIEQQEETKEA